MESERIMRKWGQRRRWTAETKEQLVYAFIDELGTEALSIFDRYLAKTAAEEDEQTTGREDEQARTPAPSHRGGILATSAVRTRHTGDTGFDDLIPGTPAAVQRKK